MNQQDTSLSTFSDVATAPMTNPGPVATTQNPMNQPLDAGVLPSNNYAQPSIFPTPANTQSAPTSSSNSNYQRQQQQQQQHGESAPPRKRTRATPEQLAVLEKTFSVNPSPNNRIREQLSRELGMSERSIQIWFQNRRAKVKNLAKRSSLLHDETVRMQYYAASAAAAACQAAAYHYQQVAPDGSVTTNPDLYYYYYYYYYNQQQQQRRQAGWSGQHPMPGSASVPPPPSRAAAGPTTSNGAPPPPPPPPPLMAFADNAATDHPFWGTSMTPPPSSNTSPMSPTVPDPSQVTTHRSMGETVAGAAGGRMRAHSLGPYTTQTRSRHGSTDPAIAACTTSTGMPTTAAAAAGHFYRGRSYTSPVGQPYWPVAHQQQQVYQPTSFPDAGAISDTFATMQQQQQQQRQQQGQQGGSVLHGGPPPLNMGPFQGMMDAGNAA